MAYDDKLAERIRQAVGPRADVTEKKMFGGLAFLLDDEGGKVATGRDSRNKSQAELWVSVQKAFGIASDTFGDPEYSGGGLTELHAG